MYFTSCGGKTTTQTNHPSNIVSRLISLGVWSPSAAGFALQRVAEDNQGPYTDSAVQTVKSHFYVDDCLKSVETEKEAIALASELRQLLASGGFRLTK